MPAGTTRAPRPSYENTVVGAVQLSSVKIRPERRGSLASSSIHPREGIAISVAFVARQRSRKRLARGSVRSIYHTLSAILSEAVEDRLIKANPLQGLWKRLNKSAKKVERVKVKAFDREQARLFLAGAQRHAPEHYAYFCTLMWAGLLSIGRTARRTWAMDAIDVARTAASAGVPGTSSEGIDGAGLTGEAIALARTAGDPTLLLDALTIGSLHLGAVGSHPDILQSLNAEARELAESLASPWYIAMVSVLDGLAEYVAGDLEQSMTTLRSAIDAFLAP